MKKIYSREIKKEEFKQASADVFEVLSQEEISTFFNLFCEIYENRVLKEK